MPTTARKTTEQTEAYSVEVAERKDAPGAWTVEAIDGDGGIEQAIFAGPRARDRAEMYARFKYGHALTNESQ